MSIPYDLLLEALERTGQRVRRGSARGEAGRTARAQCPAHDSHGYGLTLSLAETAEGAVLLHCHAGCQAEQVLAAVGLQPADLYPSASETRGRGRGGGAPSIGTSWRGVAAAADQLEDAARAADPVLARAARELALQARAAMRTERRMHQ